MGSMDAAALTVQLASPDVDQRIAAAEALSRLGEEARPASGFLVRAMGDEDEEVREWVNSALEGLGPPDPADAEPLADLLGDRNPAIGYWAATLLGRLGSDAAKTVPQLAAVVDSELALEVRRRAAWALGRIGRPATSAVDELRKAAGSGDARLARLANASLDQIVDSGTEGDEPPTDQA